MDKDEMKDRISLALKDPILQQGFEIICKENAELKEIIDNDVDKKIYVQLAKKAELADVQKGQLTEAKELLAKWVELFKPKLEGFPKTPIQVDTEAFLKE